MSDEAFETPCALIVMGVSGSGKSTIAVRLAERLSWTFEDGDVACGVKTVAVLESPR